MYQIHTMMLQADSKASSGDLLAAARLIHDAVAFPSNRFFALLFTHSSTLSARSLAYLTHLEFLLLIRNRLVSTMS
jgi:hypothetical protein